MIGTRTRLGRQKSLHITTLPLRISFGKREKCSERQRDRLVRSGRRSKKPVPDFWRFSRLVMQCSRDVPRGFNS